MTHVWTSAEIIGACGVTFLLNALLTLYLMGRPAPHKRHDEPPLEPVPLETTKADGHETEVAGLTPEQLAKRERIMDEFRKGGGK